MNGSRSWSLTPALTGDLGVQYQTSKYNKLFYVFIFI
jgi:hypothetical protein